jgi:hypothetical protein
MTPPLRLKETIPVCQRRRRICKHKSHGCITQLCATPCSDSGGRLCHYVFALLPRVEGRGGAALAQFRRDRRPECSGLVGLSGLYRFLDPGSICNRLRWHSRPARSRLDRRCFGSFDRRAIVRHARISRLAVLRGLPSQSWTVFYAALRSRDPLYRLGFPSTSGSRPKLCKIWACLGSAFLRVGIANVVAGAMGEARLEATPLAALATDTILGINESSTRVTQAAAKVQAEAIQSAPKHARGVVTAGIR